MNAATMLVRRMSFPYPASLKGWWNAARPEFSHMVNAGSLSMPYLEPYLIEVMKQARTRITDPQLRQDVDLYIAQESTHFRQHQQFNRRLADMGYASVPAHEARLKADYEALGKNRSLTFNIAYAEGFEAMGLCVGHMLIEDREYLFGNADPAVSSLILWHFVEEVEHKRAAFDVYQAVVGSYAQRMRGLAYAMWHTLRRTRQAYVMLLEADGRWGTLRTRVAMKLLMARIAAHCLPRILEAVLPWHDPARVADPPWIREWIELYERDEPGLLRLDTGRIAAMPAALVGKGEA